jgi:hypothetical protein
MAVDAKKLELGPAEVYLYPKPVASLETNLGGTQDDLRFVAQKPGAAGNSITIAYVVSGTNTPLSVAVSGTAITVNVATSGAGAATSTAKDVRDKVNNTAKAWALVKVMYKTGNDGTGVVAALAATPLTGGSDTGVETSVGALGDDLQVTIATEAQVLTAAQTGTMPQGKVISGGRLQIAVPFKEITLENFQRAIPNAVLFDDKAGTPKKRVEFVSRVGLSMRDLAQKMEIRKITAGVESTAPADILVLNEVSPVEGEVLIPYSPTDQRVITATFEAWPDSRGLYGSFGDQDF